MKIEKESRFYTQEERRYQKFKGLQRLKKFRSLFLRFSIVCGVVVALSAMGLGNSGNEMEESIIEIENPTNKVTEVRIGLVHPLLWQATLEALSFMPLLEANPVAGVILTDWASTPIPQNEEESGQSVRAPRQADEEYMINAHFLSQSLEPNALRLNIFRRIPSEDGNWRATTVPDELSSKLLDVIWSRVREQREAKKLSGS